jgi:hypothetical protein
MKNLKVLKLISGEEIIAEVVTKDEPDTESLYQYTIKNALLLMMTNDKTKGLGVAIVPWGNHTAGGQMTINMEHVIYAADPRQELVDQYTSIFSGLALPEKGLITG